MAATADIVKRSHAEVAVSDEFSTRFPALAPDEEMAELLEESFEGNEPTVRDLVRVGFPTGGKTSWIVTKGGEEKLIKELTGVLVLQSPQRVFWTNPEPTGSAPECMSMDGKTPVAGGLYGMDGVRADKNPSGTCKDCPMAQWGSDLKGRAGQGCKERKLLFLITEGAMLPTVVTVPPSSLKIFKEFVYGLATDRIGYWAIEIGLSLTEATSSDGQKFARLKPRVIRELDASEATVAKSYKNTVREWVANSPATMFVDSAGDPADNGVNLEDYDQ